MCPDHDAGSASEKLRSLLQREAFLFDGIDQKLVDQKGGRMSWVLYMWNIALTSEGANLIGQSLLEVLSKFDSVQIASYGLTSLPLVTAVVTLSGGKYNGICIRKSREKHGTCRQIEGKGDPSKPVVVIDDCLCSGGSLNKAIAVLEREGYTVEGCLPIVNFPWRGGAEWARSLGYRVESLFDVWKDFGIEMPVHSSERRAPPPWNSLTSADEGLDPAQAARQMIEKYLETGSIPNAPKKFDRDYDARGGVFVSLRDKTTGKRIARNGFLNIDPSKADLSSDLACAVNKTLTSSLTAIQEHGVERLKIGVSLLSEQEPILPGLLDFREYGLTIRSVVHPWKIGGALPNTQFYNSDIGQLTHASKQGRFNGVEPLLYYRYKVEKVLEPGESWPAYGVSATQNFPSDGELATLGSELIAYIKSVIISDLKGIPISANEPGSLPKLNVKGVGVSLYRQGMIGCWCQFSGDPADAVRRATLGALHDPRYESRRDSIDVEQVDITVSLLHNGETVGRSDEEKVSARLRLGLDSLAIKRDGRQTTMLAFVPAHYDWSGKTMATRLLRKAKIDGNDGVWRTYQTTSWLSQGQKLWPLVSGYPQKAVVDISLEKVESDIASLANYIVAQSDEHNLPKYCFWPTYNKWTTKGTVSRVILAILALYEAAIFLRSPELKERAVKSIKAVCDFVCDGHDGDIAQKTELQLSTGAEAMLLLCLTSTGKLITGFEEIAYSLFEKTSGYLHCDGSITPKPKGKRIGIDHDILPGVVLLAYIGFCRATEQAIAPKILEKYLEWYKRRFRLMHPWGLTWWHMQAWGAAYGSSGDEASAEFVFELADWAVDHQLEKTGAFLVGYSKTGPGFHTACVIEGIADAWQLAKLTEDPVREQKYRTAWTRGTQFMDQLIVRSEDTFFMQDPASAVGGVRLSPTSTCMRIDFTAHLLRALVKGASNLRK